MAAKHNTTPLPTRPSPKAQRAERQLVATGARLVAVEADWQRLADQTMEMKSTDVPPAAKARIGRLVDKTWALRAALISQPATTMAGLIAKARGVWAQNQPDLPNPESDGGLGHSLALDLLRIFAGEPVPGSCEALLRETLPLWIESEAVNHPEELPIVERIWAIEAQILRTAPLTVADALVVLIIARQELVVEIEGSRTREIEGRAETALIAQSRALRVLLQHLGIEQESLGAQHYLHTEAREAEAYHASGARS